MHVVEQIMGDFVYLYLTVVHTNIFLVSLHINFSLKYTNSSSVLFVYCRISVTHFPRKAALTQDGY